jgi:hypothetical protein
MPFKPARTAKVRLRPLASRQITELTRALRDTLLVCVDGRNAAWRTEQLIAGIKRNEAYISRRPEEFVVEGDSEPATLDTS